MAGLKAAYADPPYLGLAAEFYGERHEDAAAYDVSTMVSMDPKESKPIFPPSAPGRR